MKIKKFIDCYIPTETCNLRCHYCYITQQRKFNTKIVTFNREPREIRNALSVERLGGTCLFNICAGGETLLGSEIIGVIKELLEEGHFVMIVTNGTLAKKFDEIVEFPKKLLNRLFFKFSFHYLELLRIDKLDLFFMNIEKVKTAGCSFTVEITPSDELVSHIMDIQEVCIEKLGALCHVTIARDDRVSDIKILSEYSLKEYKEIWSVFKSDLFEFKTTIFSNKRNEFCYAGDWSYYVNLVSGDVKQCYCGKVLDNLYKDNKKPLRTEAIGNNCTLPHCYNGHAFLTLGTIPELITPSYAEMRDRVDKEGNHWLTPEVKEIMCEKLENVNLPYSDLKKKEVTKKGQIYRFTQLPRKLARTLKRRFRSKRE